MANALPGSTRGIIDRILDYLGNDEGIDLIHLNNELETLNESFTSEGVNKLNANEIETLLDGIKIIESQLKSLGLVSHLLKNMNDLLYNKN